MSEPLSTETRELRLLYTKYFNLRASGVYGNIRYSLDDLRREPLKGLISNLEAQGKQIFHVDIKAMYNLAWCEATNGLRKAIYAYVQASDAKDYEEADRLNDYLLSEYNFDVHMMNREGGK